MRRRSLRPSWLLALAALTANAAADVVHLLDGDTISGKVATSNGATTC